MRSGSATMNQLTISLEVSDRRVSLDAIPRETFGAIQHPALRTMNISFIL
jgi:hypothetical protein